MVLKENDHSDMSSFLAPSTSAWGSVRQQTVVDVTSVDEFAASQGINHVDILKSDTQGFELDVFRGAEKLFCENRVSMVFFEFICSEMYEQLPAFTRLFDVLLGHDFRLVAVYDQHFQQGLLSWADALFVHRALLR
jgi:hypothetical protein